MGPSHKLCVVLRCQAEPELLIRSPASLLLPVSALCRSTAVSWPSADLKYRYRCQSTGIFSWKIQTGRRRLSFINGAVYLLCQSCVHQVSNRGRTAVCCGIIGLGSVWNPHSPQKLVLVWLKFPHFGGLLWNNFSFYVLCFYTYDEVKLDSRRATRSPEVPSLPQEPAVGVPQCWALI